MISVELIKRRGKCDDICNACSNEIANFRIRYGAPEVWTGIDQNTKEG